MFMILEI